MRPTALRVLILVACLVSTYCGGSDPTGTNPSPGAGGSGGNGGGSGGGTGGGSDTVRETSQVTDSAFNDDDWDQVVETYGASGTGSAGHLSFNSQAGADYRQVSIRITSGGPDATIAVFAIKRHEQYFPSSDGAILWIDYSESSINQAANFQYGAPAIRQNGKLYTLVPGGKAFTTAEPAWTEHSLTHLTQDDFRTIASATDHPDFSRNGSRIEIGFMRLQVGGGDTKAGIDNYRLVLYRN
jgi:ABC-type glycerol-3-phosphate transport system substrate-binding protein